MAKKLPSGTVQLIIEGLVAGLTHLEIAAQAKVSNVTVSKYALKEEIKAEVEQRRQAKLDKKLETFAEVSEKEMDELKKWADEAIAHVEDIMKASKMCRTGGMGAMNKSLQIIRSTPNEDVRFSEAIALLKAGHDLLINSFELEARALGIYDLAEQVSERNKQQRQAES